MKQDSKYDEIKELSKKNKMLEKRIKELQSELDEIDEFKMVIQDRENKLSFKKNLSDHSYGERRVNFLKALRETKRR